MPLGKHLARDIYVGRIRSERIHSYLDRDGPLRGRGMHWHHGLQQPKEVISQSHWPPELVYWS